MDSDLTRLFHSLDADDPASLAEFHRALERRGLGAAPMRSMGWALRTSTGWEGNYGAWGVKTPTVFYETQAAAELRGQRIAADYEYSQTAFDLVRVAQATLEFEVVEVFYQAEATIPTIPEWKIDLAELDSAIKELGEIRAGTLIIPPALLSRTMGAAGSLALGLNAVDLVPDVTGLPAMLAYVSMKRFADRVREWDGPR